jgi:hypothetical protein
MKTNLYIRLTTVFTALILFAFCASAQTTINVKVSEANDDVEEFRGEFEGNPDGFMDHGSSDLELCTQNENNKQMIGIIFRNVQIPAGVTITSAYVQFTCDDDNDEAITIDIWGIKEANTSAPFTEDLFNVSSRPSTTATVNWAPPAWMVLEERGPDQQTPDLKDIIQEIIGLDGWASGNNLGIKLTNEVTAKEHREAEAFEDNDGAGAAELFVTYTEGGGGGEPTTISVQIIDAMDDIEESAEDWSGHPTGTIDESSSDLEFINEDGLQFVGMIFRNVEIPPNETINSAYIQFHSDKALSGDVTCELYGAAEANVVAPFTTDPFSVSVHTSTIASVSWTIPAWGEFGVATEAERTPDISSIIAEIVALDGWASGNNLMIGGRGSSFGKIDNREAVSFDGEPTMAAILNVTYGGPVKVQPKHSELSNFIYPNPTEGRFYITNPSKDRFGYDIYSINGRLVASRHDIAGSTVEVDLSNIAKGMYFVNVRTSEKAETYKLILQ